MLLKLVTITELFLLPCYLSCSCTISLAADRTTRFVFSSHWDPSSGSDHVQCSSFMVFHFCLWPSVFHDILL